MLKTLNVSLCISCRSESSNISVVVLDNLSLCPNAPQARLDSGMHFLGESSELVKLLYLSPGVTPSGRSPTGLRPQTWWGFETKSSRSRRREISASSVRTPAGHLPAEIWTSSLSNLPGYRQLHIKGGIKSQVVLLFLLTKMYLSPEKCLQHHVFPGGHPSKY